MRQARKPRRSKTITEWLLVKYQLKAGAAFEFCRDAVWVFYR